MKKSILKTPLTFKEKLILKFMLLSVWFVKNIGTIVYTFLSVCLILTLFTVIKPTTPYLGVIFGGLSEDIESFKNMDFTLSNVISIIVKFSTLVTTIVLFGKRIKTITESDIHSKKLKILIYRAGYRYDIRNGSRLMKHVTAVGDKAGIVVSNKIDDIEKVEDTNIVEGIKRVTNEFVTIITVNPETTVPLEDLKNGVDITVDNTDKEVKKLNSDIVEDTNRKVSIIQMIIMSFQRFIKNIKAIERVHKKMNNKQKEEKIVNEDVKVNKLTKDEKEIIVVKRNKKDENSDDLEKVNVIKEVVEEVVEKVITVGEAILDKVSSKDEEVVVEESKVKENKPKKSLFTKKDKENEVVVKDVNNNIVTTVPKKELSQRERLESKMNRFKK